MSVDVYGWMSVDGCLRGRGFTRRDERRSNRVFLDQTAFQILQILCAVRAGRSSGEGRSVEGLDEALSGDCCIHHPFSVCDFSVGRSDSDSRNFFI